MCRSWTVYFWIFIFHLFIHFLFKGLCFNYVAFFRAYCGKVLGYSGEISPELYYLCVYIGLKASGFGEIIISDADMCLVFVGLLCWGLLFFGFCFFLILRWVLGLCVALKRVIFRSCQLWPLGVPHIQVKCVSTYYELILRVGDMLRVV